jgi:ABC-type glycerol-3-phosphate transport system substrate-binding protein
VAEPPQRWSEIIENGVTLLFPAADPQALYTLTMYRASGGLASDDNGSPHLDSDILGDVLAHYAEAEQAGAMPYWITQYQSDEQVWQAFLEDRTTQAATWATNYLAAPPEDVAMATLPTPDGEAYTLATGWVWALTTRPAENQQLSVELAEFLTEGNFLGQWSGSLGYLPVRPSALAAGPDRTLNQVIEEVVQSAVLFPPSDVIVSLGIPLQGATVDVLKQQADPVSAAQAAAAGLNEP